MPIEINRVAIRHVQNENPDDDDDDDDVVVVVVVVVLNAVQNS